MVGMELQLGVLPCPQHRGWDIPRGLRRSPCPGPAQARPGSHSRELHGDALQDLRCALGRAGRDEGQG